MALKTIASDYIDFEYEAVKTKYTRSVNKFLQTQDKPTPYTREWVNEIMLKVKKHKKEGTTTSCNQVKINNSLYDILSMNGVAKLVCLKDSKVLEVLDSEESFNVFVDFHLRDGHCKGQGFCRIYYIMSNFFDFSKDFLLIFIKSCDVCTKPQSMNMENIGVDEKDNVFNSLVHIIFLNMSSCVAPIHEYKYLLVHRDEVSGYVLLRPLIELDAGEVASELYKIFVDFGPPKNIQTTHPAFLQDVLKLLKQSPIRYTSIVSENIFDDDELKSKVTDYINKWIDYSNCSDWPLTCYAVQFSMNTEGDNAMEKVFGKRVSQTAKLSLSTEKTNKTEVMSPSTKHHSATDSASSISFDEDMSDTENINSVDQMSSSTGVSATGSIFVDRGSTSTTEQSTDKPERLKCVVCDRVFLYTANVHTCDKCKKFVHIYCGRRFSADSGYFVEIDFFCNNCLHFEAVL